MSDQWILDRFAAAEDRLTEARDEVARLRADNQRLRAGIQKAATAIDNYDYDTSLLDIQEGLEELLEEQSA